MLILYIVDGIDKGMFAVVLPAWGDLSGWMFLVGVFKRDLTGDLVSNLAKGAQLCLQSRLVA